MSDTQVLGGLVTALTALVAVLGYLLKRKGTNGHASAEDQIASNIALIEREDIDLPKNWRQFVDERIQHYDRNRRAKAAAYATLLERGQTEKVIAMLREDAEEK